ncbi:uncharacterized protein LOC105424664 [Pogonomyrmex barbatus]|uniref:Uncharacterized protein LOC105424664 n=1 Tax=Pogonomyrmex barbatus TaxID=144034 RepID=A0A8N1S5S1_9HYME|nr:uncharacterized protein LOC105424664 [Pogonomyrmex barbatus]
MPRDLPANSGIRTGRQSQTQESEIQRVDGFIVSSYAPLSQPREEGNEAIDTTARLIAKLAEKAMEEFRQQQVKEGRLLRSKANYFIPTCRLCPVLEVNSRRYRIEWTPSFKSPFSRFVLGFAY